MFESAIVYHLQMPQSMVQSDQDCFFHFITIYCASLLCFCVDICFEDIVIAILNLLLFITIITVLCELMDSFYLLIFQNGFNKVLEVFC